MKILVLSLLFVGTPLIADDLQAFVRQVSLDQGNPVTVRCSTESTTTILLPEAIQTIGGDAFTKDPGRGKGDFYIATGTKSGNWIFLRALKKGARQNLAVIIQNRVYQFYCIEGDRYDFSVLCSYEATGESIAWRPPLKP